MIGDRKPETGKENREMGKVERGMEAGNRR